MLHVFLLAATGAQATPAPKHQPLYGCYARTDCNRKPYVCFAGVAWEPCGTSHPAEYVLVHVDGLHRFKIDGRTYLLRDLDKYFKGLRSVSKRKSCYRPKVSRSAKSSDTANRSHGTAGCSKSISSV